MRKLERVIWGIGSMGYLALTAAGCSGTQADKLGNTVNGRDAEAPDAQVLDVGADVAHPPIETDTSTDSALPTSETTIDSAVTDSAMSTAPTSPPVEAGPDGSVGARCFSPEVNPLLAGLIPGCPCVDDDGSSDTCIGLGDFLQPAWCENGFWHAATREESMLADDLCAPYRANDGGLCAPMVSGQLPRHPAAVDSEPSVNTPACQEGCGYRAQQLEEYDYVYDPSLACPALDAEYCAFLEPLVFAPRACEEDADCSLLEGNLEQCEPVFDTGALFETKKDTAEEQWLHRKNVQRWKAAGCGHEYLGWDGPARVVACNEGVCGLREAEYGCGTFPSEDGGI